MEAHVDFTWSVQTLLLIQILEVLNLWSVCVAASDDFLVLRTRPNRFRLVFNMFSSNVLFKIEIFSSSSLINAFSILSLSSS